MNNQPYHNKFSPVPEKQDIVTDTMENVIFTSLSKNLFLNTKVSKCIPLIRLAFIGQGIKDFSNDTIINLINNN